MQKDSQCTNGTTRPAITKTAEGEASSSDPAKLSCFEPSTATLSLFGESLSTTRDSKESTAPCSETRASTKAATLSDRLTPLLISRGLVRGTIPTSIRKPSGQQTLDIAFFEPDGGDVGLQNEGS